MRNPGGHQDHSRPRLPFLGSLAAVVLLAIGVLVVPLPQTLVTTPSTPRADAAGTPACGGAGLPSVTTLHDANFYIDTSLTPKLLANYAGYTLRTPVAASDLYFGIGNFTGGVIGLGSGQPAVQAVPTLAAGGSDAIYAMMVATITTTTPQSHTVTVYQGNPALGGTALCASTFTYLRVVDTIKAAANKVTSVVPTAPLGTTAYVGQVVDIVVTGNTGTLGAGPAFDPGALAYTPTVYAAFPAGSWLLERTQLVISPDGSAPQQTIVDDLFLAGASGGARPYTVTYRFRAIAPTAQSAQVTPVQYIASGTQIKHTDIAGVGLTLPPIADTLPAALTKSVSPTTVAATGGTVSYTIVIDNDATWQLDLDRIVDTLPSGVTYVSGSSKLDGGAIGNPKITGSVLTFPGPIPVAPLQTRTLTFNATVAAGSGTKVNSVYARVGTTQLDFTSSLTDDVPATATLALASGPDAVNDTASTQSNTPVKISVLTNDTSASNSPITLTAASDPPKGTVTINPDGTITYVPDAGFSGTDTFTYTISDGYGTDTATVTVTVGPLAATDNYGVARNGTLNGNVITNDTCTTCTVTLVAGSGPTNGTLTLNSNGTFTYQATNSKTSVKFQYTITDSSTGLTSTTWAYIEVGGAIADYGTTPFQTPLATTVVTNDYCGNVACSDLTVTVAPTNGTASVTTTNSVITYTPNTGFHGIDTYTYTIDGQGFQNEAGLVTVLVMPPARVQETPHDTAATGSLLSASCSRCVVTLVDPVENGSLTLNPDGTFTYVPDPDFVGSDTFTYRITDPVTGNTGTQTYTFEVGPLAVDDTAVTDIGTPVTIDADANDECTVSCTIAVATQPGHGTATVVNGEIVYTPTAGFFGTDTFTYTITDPTTGLTSTATATVTVLGAFDDSQTTPAGTATTVSVLTNDPCNSCTITATTSPSTGSIVVNANGTITYTPEGDFSGQVTFTYTATDGAGNSSTATVTITVIPEAINDTATTTATAPVTIYVLDNDVCIGCTVTGVTGVTPGATVTINTDGTIDYKAPSGFAGTTDTFTYNFIDAYGHTDTATVTVTITQPPTATNDVKTGTPGAAVVVDAALNDSCPTCLVELISQSATGVTDVRVDGKVQFVPPSGFTGRVDFDYQLTDPTTGLSTTATITIIIPPESEDETVYTPINQAITIEMQANDICLDCTVTITMPSSNGTATPQPDGTIIFTPTPGFAGTTTFQYTLTDPTINAAGAVGVLAVNDSTTSTVTILVSNGVPDMSTTPFDTPVTLNVLANDVCTSCTVTGTSGVTNGTATFTGGSVTFTPTAGFSGLTTFTYTASNGAENVTSTMTVLVTPPVDAVSTAPETTLTDAVPLVSCVGCVITFVSGAEDGALTLNADGTYTYEPFEGTAADTFTYRVTDPVTGLFVDSVVNITVGSTVASIEVIAATTATEYDAIGDTIPITFIIENTGNVTLTGVNETDLGLEDGGTLSCTPVLPATLAPNEVVNCSFTYTITQADLDAGQLTDAIDVTGTYTSTAVTDTSNLLTVPAVQNPDFTVTKTASPTSVDSVNDPVVFTVTVTNTGNVTLDDIAATDPICTLVTTGTGTLAPGATRSFTCTYLTTQVDLNAGSIMNTTTASATDPDDQPLAPKSDGETVTVTQDASISVSKTANVTTVAAVQDEIVYTVTVTNTGNVSLSTITLDDPDCPGLVTSATGPLLPGVSRSYTCTYDVIQDDLNNGSIVNTVSVTATAVSGAAVGPQTDSVTVDVDERLGISVVKTADPSSVDAAGDVITYTVRVSNIGNVNLANIVPDDPKCPLTSTDTGVLLPGESRVFSCDYTVTQADVDAGTVTNVVTVDADDTLGNPITPRTDTETVTVDQRPSFTVQKTSDVATVDAITDSIVYTVRVTNTGNVTLTDISVADPVCDPTTTDPDATPLAPSAFRDYTCTYAVLQADLDAGSIVNLATVTAVDTDGQQVGPVSDGATVAAIQGASLSVTKTADAASVEAVGDPVVYTVVVTNTGNVTLSDLVVDDPRCTLTSVDSGPLAAGASRTYTCTYLTTQADLDAGTFTNTVTASAEDPSGGVVTPVTEQETVSALQDPDFAVAKTASVDSYANVGDSIIYTVTVTNTGDVTLYDITATDPLCTLTSNSSGGLAPSATRSFTCTISVTQTEIDAGSIMNTVTVSADDPAGTDLPDKTAVETVAASQSAAFTVSKSSDVELVDTVGDQIVYAVRVTNIGNVTLTDITPVDAECTLGSAAGPLAPGASRVVTCTYAVTQADIDAGSIGNTVDVTAKDPDGLTVGPVSDTDTVAVDTTTSLRVVKSADRTSINDLGDDITFTVTVTNTGNTTLDDVVATDASCPALSSADTGPLAPGAQRVYTCLYDVTQSDLNNGTVVNTVSVTAVDPLDVAVGPVVDEVTVDVDQLARFTVVKSADVTEVDAVGDTILYTVTVTNTGNVSLDAITPTDPLCALTSLTTGPLAPGLARDFTCTYPVTQGDLDAGSIVNVVSVVADDPSGTPTPPVSSGETVVSVQNPQFTVTKSADVAAVDALGDPVVYSFTVNNTGNVTLDGFVLSDPFCTITFTPGPLAPAASRVGTCTYAVTQADLDLGSVDNTVTVTATDPDGDPVGPETDSLSIPATQDPSLDVTKTASPAQVTSVGDVVTFTVTVENTGDVTLSDLMAGDTLCTLSSNFSGPLAPGATRAFACTYVVSQADLDAGSITNLATVSAADPLGGPVGPGTDATSVTAGQTAAFTVSKTADVTMVDRVGDDIVYTVLVTNIGNVTIDQIVATDPNCTLTTTGAGGLAPGSSRAFSCVYPVSQADLDGGVVDNTVVVVAEGPGGVLPSVSDSVSVVVDQRPGLSVVKSGSPLSVDAAGDVVGFSVTVRNTGNVTLSDVVPVDGLCPLSPVSVAVLAPGGVQVFSCEYTVSQADVDAGSVTNTVSVSAEDPDGGLVGPRTDSERLVVDQAPSLSVVKSADVSLVDAAGDAVEFSVLVTNTGNVTLDGVVPVDAVCALDTVPAGGVIPVSVDGVVPGGSVLFSCEYTVSQADVDAGSVVNSVSVSAVDPSSTVVGPVSDVVVVPVEQGPALSVSKTADLTGVDSVGDIVTFTVVVENVGNVTLSDVVPVDAMCVLVSTDSGPLVPGDDRSFSCDYVVTQVDLDRGALVNTVSVTASDPSGGSVGPVTDGVSVPVVQDPSFTVAKTADVGSVDAVGETVTFTVTVVNTGNVTLSDVRPSDALCVLSPVTTGDLAPKASRTFTCEYAVTQADLNAGQVVNSVSVSAKDPAGDPVGPVSDGETVPVDQLPSFTVVKSANVARVDAVGDTVVYTVTVRNTGNVNLSGFVLVDPRCQPTSLASGVLLPGVERVFSCTYTVSQADLDAGEVANSVSVTAEDPAGGPVGPVTDSVTIPVEQGPAFSVVKTADLSSITADGDEVTFTVTVSNTGNVTLTDVTPVDPTCDTALSPVSVSSLAPDTSVVFTCTYTVTQDDVDSGVVNNTVSVTATDPTGATTGPVTATETVPVQQDPGFTVDKVSDVSSVDELTDDVVYTITVTNTGNVSLTDITPVDALCVLVEAAGPLAPGASAEFTCTYDVTQADLDRGTVTNTVSVTATDPAGAPVGPVVDDTTLDVVQSPSFTAVKDADLTTVDEAGDVIVYTVTVTNDGNVTLGNVAVSDELCTLTSNQTGPLAPGASRVFSCDYVVSQADLDAGGVTNLATVTADTPDGTPLTPEPAAHVVPGTQTPAMVVTKTADVTSVGAVGDDIVYTVRVRNTGNVTLTDIVVADPLCTPTSTGTGPLRPGSERIYTCVYTVTQADLDAGVIDNTVTVAADDPAGDPLTPVTDERSVPVDQRPAFTVVKSADVMSVSEPGPITFTVVVRNTGNVTLDDVDPVDALCPLSSPDSGPLAPRAQRTFTCEYTVTTADIDAGAITNTVSVTAKDPAGDPVGPIADTTVVMVEQQPSFSVTKSADLTLVDAAGDTVEFSVLVTNTGNVSLDDVTPADAECVLSSPDTGPLAPGAERVFTCDYVVSQADIDAGSILNVVSVTATDPTGDPVGPVSDLARVPVDQVGSMSVTKTADVGQVDGVDDLIGYDVVVTNTGNLTLDDVTPVDTRCPLTSVTSGPLAPGASRVFSCDYDVTQVDLDTGTITNDVTVTAVGPDGRPVGPVEDRVTVSVGQGPALSIDKRASVASIDGADAVILFTVDVENIGNVTLDEIAVTDSLCVLRSTASGPLAPGATRAYSCTYVSSQSDIDAGSVVNTAGATAVAPDGTRLPAVTDSVEVNATQDPSFTVEKAADATSTSKLGDQIVFSVVVTNTGNVTLTNLAPTDALCPLASRGSGPLVPGAERLFTCTYVVTQADLDAGSVDNTVSVTAKGPDGATLDPVVDTTTVPVTQQASFTVDKTANTQRVSAIDDVIEFTIVVTNTGNVTLDGLAVSDPKCPPTSAVSGPLAPGEQRVYSCTYVVTQPDLDAGSIANTVSVTADDPNGSPVGPFTDGVTVPVEQGPAFTVVKTADLTAIDAVGDVIEFSVVVTNTGNVTLYGIVPQDAVCTLSSTQTGPLVPGAVRTFTCDYVVTQADLDAGSVDNTVSVAAEDPSGNPVGPVTDATSVPVDEQPSFTVVKSSDLTEVDSLLDSVVFTVTVTNTGNVTLSGLVVSDALCILSGSTAPLAPKAVRQFTCTYAVTQADLDRGSVDNSVSVTADAPSGAPVGPVVDETSVPVDQRPSYTVAKTSDVARVDAVGDVVTFSVTVTNTGNVTLGDLVATDTLCTLSSSFTGGLAPGTQRVFSCTYVLTQADLDAGSVVNSATVDATDPGGTPIGPVTDLTTVAVDQTARTIVAKTADVAVVDSVGDPILYTIRITNVGNVTLYGVTPDDDRCTLTTVPAAAATAPLAPGSSRVFTCTYLVTQTDLDAGTVVNTVSVAATDPDGDPAPLSTDEVSVPVDQQPLFTVVKIADPATVSATGTIEYTIRVRNTGNVTLDDITPVDPLCTPTSASTAPLPPLATRVFSCSYTVTQGDLDAGSVANTVSVTASAPDGSTVGPRTDGEVVPVDVRPSISVVKDADVASVDVAGDEIAYSVTVRNTGNVTVRNIVVDDPLCEPTSLVSGDLAPSAIRVYRCTYTVTQADIDLGSIINTVSVRAIGPESVAVGPRVDSTTVLVAQRPAMTVEKTADVTTVDAVGDQVVYTVRVRNTGNVTLDALAVSDPLCTPTSLVSGALAPGGLRTYSCRYSVTQADLDAGTITNTVSALADDPNGSQVGPRVDSVDVTVDQRPSFTVAKSADVTTVDAVGDRVVYTVAVVNTGNVTLTGLAPSDPLCSLRSSSSGPLAPGAGRLFSCVYDVRQADLDAGSITNTVTVDAVDPSGTPLAPKTDREIVTVDQRPAYSVAKTAAVGTVDEAGDTVEFTVIVTNTGNVTLTEVTPSDPLCTLTSVAPGPMPPSTQRLFSCTYVVTQSDIDDGTITNTVSVRATDPTGDVLGPVGDTAVVGVDQRASFVVSKTANATSVDVAGDQVVYSVSVTNTGNVALTGVTPSDPLCTLAAPGSGPLAPGATRVFSCAYGVTQSDIDAGAVTNTVTVRATSPLGAVGPVTDAHVLPVLQGPSFSVSKTADLTDVDAAGDTIVFSVTVANTGNVSLSAITPTDAMCALRSTATGPLAPGATRLYTCSYVVTQADLDSGSLVNTVSVTATDPSGKLLGPIADTTTVPVTELPAFTVAKSADVTTVDTVGDLVRFTVTVVNTGNVSLVDVTPTDALCTLVPSSTGDLAPGATRRFTCTYVVTQTDIDRGSLVNTVWVGAKDPAGGSVGPFSDDATVAVAQRSSFTVAKSANTARVGQAGDQIVYTVTVVNTGSTTLTGITPVDPLCTLTSVATGPLTPGSSRSFGCAYTVTQADVDAGSVSNTVSVGATGPDGRPLSAVGATEVVPVEQGPSFTVVKTSDVAEVDAVGDTVTFRVRVTNTGNVSLSNIQPDDAMCVLRSTDAGPLRPDAVRDFSCTYIVSQADLDGGSIVNTVSVTATDPNGRPLAATTDTTTVPVQQRPAFSVVKTADVATVSAVGDRVQFRVTVANTGNTLIDGIQVIDRTCTLSSTSGGPLAPGAVRLYTCTYVTTQADLDAGSIANTVDVTARGPGEIDPAPNTAGTVVPVTNAPAIEVVATSGVTTFDVPGDLVPVTFVITNTGNTTLTGVTVDDLGLDDAGTLSCLPTLPTTLAPSAAATCTFDYVVTQRDIDLGQVVDVISVSGMPPGASAVPVTDVSDELTWLADQSASIAISKVSDVSTFDSVGDPIVYTVTVTNTGNLTLIDLVVSDPLCTLRAVDPSVRVLAPGASADWTCTYLTTQADLDRGGIPNTATATADAAPDPGSVQTAAIISVGPVEDSVIVTPVLRPAMTATKTSDTTRIERVGQVIRYTVAVANTGNVTLGGVNARDPLCALAGAVTTLEPNAVGTFTCDYVVTQRDLDAGSIVNSVEVTADAAACPPSGCEISARGSVTVTAAQGPALMVSKSATPQSVTAGQSVTFRIDVTNTGNVAVRDVRVFDPMCAVTFSGTDTGADAQIGVGETWSYTCTYVTTVNDGLAGLIRNTVSVRATTSAGTAVEAAGEVAVVVTPSIPGTLPETGASTVLRTIRAAVFLVLVGTVLAMVALRRRRRRIS